MWKKQEQGPILIPCNILPYPSSTVGNRNSLIHYNPTESTIKYHLVLIFKEDMVHFLSYNSSFFPHFRERRFY